MRPLSTNIRLWGSMLIVLVLLLAVFFVIGYFLEIFVYLLGAIILSYVIKPLVIKLSHYGVPKKLALPFVFIFFLLFAAAATYMFVPMVAGEIRAISDEWPTVKERIDSEILTITTDEDGSTRYFSPLFNTEVDPQDIERLEQALVGVVSSLISVSSSVLFGILIIPILTVIILKDGTRMKKEFYRLIPNRYFEVVLSIIEDINKSVGNFIYAKGIQVVILALVSVIGYSLIGIKGAILLGVLAGILNIIPYLGPAITIVLTSLVGYVFHDVSMVLYAGAVWGAAQVIDNAIIQPVILPKLLSHHPLTVILVTLVGAKLLGAFGMVIAIPVFAVFSIVFQKVYLGLESVYEKKGKPIS